MFVDIFYLCFFHKDSIWLSLLLVPGFPLQPFFCYFGAELRAFFVGSVVEWLKHRTDDQHGLGSKPTQAILLCPWERHFTALSPAWWS